MPTKFQLPQFIEHEAKVIGPLTLRRAIYLGIPLAINFLLYFQMAENLILFLAIAAGLEGIGAALAFVKVGGKSIPEVIMHMLFFISRPKTYIWKRGKTQFHFKEMQYGTPSEEGEEPKKVELVQRSRIMDLATKVQTKK